MHAKGAYLAVRDVCSHLMHASHGFRATCHSAHFFLTLAALVEVLVVTELVVAALVERCRCYLLRLLIAPCVVISAFVLLLDRVDID